MSFSDQQPRDAHAGDTTTDDFENPRGPLHRIGIARRQQGMSLRTVASRMQTTVSELRSQEDDDADLPLSVLYRWCQVLDVPVEELLVEPKDTFSTPILQRTQMMHLMKTAMAIQENCRSEQVGRLVTTMIDQLVDAMPELKEIRTRQPAPDKSSSKRLGRAAYHTLPDTLFCEGN